MSTYLYNKDSGYSILSITLLIHLLCVIKYMHILDKYTVLFCGCVFYLIGNKRHCAIHLIWVLLYFFLVTFTHCCKAFCPIQNPQFAHPVLWDWKLDCLQLFVITSFVLLWSCVRVSQGYISRNGSAVL